MVKTSKFLAVMLVILWARSASGNTISAATCNTNDVQAAINSANDGDVVVIPSGSCTWTSGITTTKQIHITAQTVVGPPNETVVITNSAGSSDLLTMTTGNSFHVQISGIKFLRGNGTGGDITMNGSGSKVALVDNVYIRVDDNFNILHHVFWNTVGGVWWNSTLESLTPGGGNGPGAGSGSFVMKSPKPWLAASTWGTQDTNGDQNVYFEDMNFNYIYNQALDCDDNCRFVVRHSNILDSQFLHHGTTSLEGGRQSEFYNNNFEYQSASFGDTYHDVNLNRYIWFRAGTAYIHDNAVQSISSQTWGTKTSFVFIDESLTRPGSGAPCQTTYPGTHWPGQGANGTSQISDPVHIWNNTGTWTWNTDDQPDQCGHGLSTANFFILNRDVFLGSPANYTPYPYPHPLRQQGSSSQAPAPPTALSLTTK